MQIKIKKLKPAVKTPNYALPGDVGLDLYSLVDCELEPRNRQIFELGFALEIPDGYGAFVMDKGGMAKNCIHTMGGVFDAGYRGEYLVQLINLGRKSYQIKAGDKIAQLVILPVAVAQLVETSELSSSERGEGRFGSTGK